MKRTLRYLVSLNLQPPLEKGNSRPVPLGVSFCPENKQEPIEIWEGFGWESNGGSYSAAEALTQFRSDLAKANAQWFIPYIERMNGGEEAHLSEVQAKHYELFGCPMRTAGLGEQFSSLP